MLSRSVRLTRGSTFTVPNDYNDLTGIRDVISCLNLDVTTIEVTTNNGEVCIHTPHTLDFTSLVTLTPEYLPRLIRHFQRRLTINTDDGLFTNFQSPSSLGDPPITNGPICTKEYQQ